ncbi:MAG TPA: prolipoprotein diacylglyceryl transferase family protein [Bacteroidota bacterium]|nr:prolipoprotein diacylglyceryl transferase family protein [Bacteroidota bacterium]
MPLPRSHIGPLLYGALFVILLPVALIAWGTAAAPNVALPSVNSFPAGLLLAGAGIIFMAWGMFSLLRYGDGLPMNPYPPENFVTRGAYRILPHPIYCGFVSACAGFSLIAGAPAGLWLVTPLVALGCVALVLGYERIDLRERFGDIDAATYLRLPPGDDGPPSLRDRLSVYVLVLAPWVLLYKATALLGVPPDAVRSYLPFEERLPVLEWTELIYAATYLFVLLAPLAAPERKSLRGYAIQGALATLLMPLFFSCIPLIAPPREFVPSGFAGGFLLLERGLDTPANSFPSYHVFWALLSARLLTAGAPRWKYAWWGMAALITVSCLTTGMHSLVDIAGGVLLWMAINRLSSFWDFLRRTAERIANSWKEWRLGPVRVINHGIYAGIGSMLAVTIVGLLVGAEHAGAFFFVACSALVVSGLWAQVVEGSPSLLRPYGFYGGVLGVIIGSVLALPLFGTDPWLLLAAYSVGGPWVQSFGRLRCLVQGCCHGSPAPPWIGIVYRHPRSRVTRLSGLGGTPVHPTPLYSILWNVVIAAVLTRLWFAHAPLTMIGALYLVLTGLGRFVEEAYRGEPQTKLIAGLRLYQWIAVATIAGGAVVTCIPSAPAPGAPSAQWLTFGTGLLFGAASWFSMGVDFPESNRRFARLA